MCRYFLRRQEDWTERIAKKYIMLNIYHMSDIAKGKPEVIHLYLDDTRHCPKGFVLARNAEECMLILQNEQVDILSLDYDLGWNEPTGGEVAKYIAVSGKFPRRIFLHTSSHLGKIKMYEMLSQNKPEDVILYNGPMPDSLIREVGGMA
jgi:hypothetical protein